MEFSGRTKKGDWQVVKRKERRKERKERVKREMCGKSGKMNQISMDGICFCFCFCLFYQLVFPFPYSSNRTLNFPEKGLLFHFLFYEDSSMSHTHYALQWAQILSSEAEAILCILWLLVRKAFPGDVCSREYLVWNSSRKDWEESKQWTWRMEKDLFCQGTGYLQLLLTLLFSSTYTNTFNGRNLELSMRTVTLKTNET